MRVSVFSWDDKLEVLEVLIKDELIDLRGPLFEALVLFQVVVIIEDLSRELASLELVSHCGVEDVLAFRVKRCAQAPRI